MKMGVKPEIVIVMISIKICDSVSLCNASCDITELLSVILLNYAIFMGGPGNGKLSYFRMQALIQNWEIIILY